MHFAPAHNSSRTRLRIPLGVAAALALLFAVAPEIRADTPPSLASDTIFVAFDVETTGFSPTRDRVVEIAAVKFRGGKVVDSKAFLVNPGRPIPARAQGVHGISDEMVADKPAFDAISAEFIAFIGDAVLLAHNASFDVNFVREEIRRAGNPLPKNQILDTLALFRRWYPELDSHRLETVAEHVGVGGEGYHRALDDARYLMDIFVHGLREQKRLLLPELVEQAGGALRFTED